MSILQPTWDLGSGGTNNSDLLCLQAENISDLEFRVANSGKRAVLRSEGSIDGREAGFEAFEDRFEA